MNDAPAQHAGVEPGRDIDRPLREMIRIALPTVAAMTSYTLMTSTDKWLCSHIGSEPIYVGAQGNGGLASWIPLSFAHGVLTIVNTYVSQNMGAGKADRGPAYAWNGFWLACLYYAMILVPLAVLLPSVFGMLAERGMDARQAELSATYGSILLWGALITLATRCVGQFFYGMGRPAVVMSAGVIANVFNLVVSCVLVFGNGPMPEALGWFGRVCSAIAGWLGIAPMGIAGSAYGTVLATLLELAIPLAIFLGPKMHARYRTRSQWRPSVARIKELVKLGWPAGATFANEMACWGFFMVYLVSHFGKLHATAGWIAHQFMSLSFMPAVGLSVATTALVGKYQGMGRSDVAVKRAWLGVKVAMVYMGLCAAVFVLFPRQLLSLFIDASTPPEDVETLVRLGTAFLWCTAAFQLFDAVAMVISGALRGAGDTVFPGVMTIACSWIIIVGGGWGMTQVFPGLQSTGPWIAAATYIAVLCVILLARFLTGKWKKIEVVKRD